MKGKKRLMIAALALAVGGGAAAFLLRGGEEEESKPIDPPLEYRISGVDVTALPVFSDRIVVYRDKPEADGENGADGAEPEAAEETAVPATAEAVVYRYEELEEASTLVSAYTTLMTARDMGFSVVDEALIRAEAPDFQAEAGTVRLAHRSPVEGEVMLIQLNWEPGTCTVVTDAPKGEIADPPVPEGMTLTEAEEFVKSIPPAALGLPGSSMEEHEIYILDGVVLIDGVPCIQVNICQVEDSTSTNVAEGVFFIASDKRAVYRLDAESGTVEPVGAAGIS